MLSDCKARWPLVSVVEKNQWEMINRAENIDRALVPVADVASSQARLSTGVWQCSLDPAVDSPLPMQQVVQQYSTRSSADRRRLAKRDDDLWVADPVPERAQFSDDRKVLGCYAQKRNVCRESLPPALAREITWMASRFSVIVDRIGAQEAQRAMTLLWLKGSETVGGDNPPLCVDRCVLLVDAHLSPKTNVL